MLKWLIQSPEGKVNIMRKLLVIVVLLSAVVSVQAHDARSQLIIVQRENALYAVSAVDGSATLLVKVAPDEQVISLRAGSMSPNGEVLAYVVTHGSGYFDPAYTANLFLLNLQDGLVERVTPEGGVFDRALPPNHILRLEHPTWSDDGQRLYYVRVESETRGETRTVASQLAYYDTLEHRHVLSARLNSAATVEGLSAVTAGIVVRSYYGLDAKTGITLYAPDNQIVNQNEIAELHRDPLQYDGRFYHPIEDSYGGLTMLVDVETGETRTIDGGYYPALRSRSAGAESLHVFRFFGSSGTWYRVYGADHKQYVGEITDNSQVQIAIAPDGQTIAFLQFDLSPVAPIQLMNAAGEVRELPFVAEQIVWGTVDAVPFYAPG